MKYFICCLGQPIRSTVITTCPFPFQPLPSRLALMHNAFVTVPVNDASGASNVIDRVTDRLEAPESLIRDPTAYPTSFSPRHNDHGKRVDAKSPLEAVV